MDLFESIQEYNNINQHLSDQNGTIVANQLRVYMAKLMWDHSINQL